MAWMHHSVVNTGGSGVVRESLRRTVYMGAVEGVNGVLEREQSAN